VISAELAFQAWLAERWVNLGTVVCAVGAGARKMLMEPISPASTHEAVVSAMNGAALFPFLALVIVPFSDQILSSVLHSSKVTFAIAGIVGSIWTINELRR
jgi:phosphate/sulfate permease